MGKRRKFFYGDMVRVIGPGYVNHRAHIGQVSGTRIYVRSAYRHTTYAVACECGTTIHPQAYKMAAWKGPPKTIEDARLDYWFRTLGIPRPKDAEAQLAKGLNLLSDREQEILSSRYGLQGRDHKTLEELAQDFGVTRERIRQIEAKAHKKVRAQPGIDLNHKEAV